jgi:hypothetical protein
LPTADAAIIIFSVFLERSHVFLATKNGDLRKLYKEEEEMWPILLQEELKKECFILLQITREGQ